MYNNLQALTESILWDGQLVAADYATISEASLRSALNNYLKAVSSYRNENGFRRSSPLNFWMADFVLPDCTG